MTDATTRDLRTALANGVGLLRTDPDAAEHQALEILAVIPDQPNALVLLAAARRRLGRDAEAVAALRAALARDPELAPAWRALSEVLWFQGELAASHRAFERYLGFAPPHADLIEAARDLAAGRLGPAEEACRARLETHPADVAALRLLADIGVRMEQFGDAEALLARCLQLAPAYATARRTYAFVLHRRLKHERAIAELDRLLAAEPDEPNHRLLKAAALVHLGRFDAAIEIYEAVLSRHPWLARVELSYGHALRAVGRREEAIAAYRRVVDLKPDLSEAYFSLANLKTFDFADAEIAAMIGQMEADEVAPEDVIYLCFALGVAEERRGGYAAAFDYYRRGNSVKRMTLPWDGDAFAADCARQKAFFTRERCAAGSGARDPDPIFVVGLPRSGSTLLEQILASHSQVDGTLELPILPDMVRRLARRRRGDPVRYPDVLARMTDAELAGLGREYLERTRPQRGDAPFFVDKMPNNFVHVGLIQLILPKARIVDARRHPMACCLSLYTQLFASGQAFSYDLEDLGRYYRDYLDLMAHWDAVLPGRVLRVLYEAVVEDPEGQIRRLLDHCRLPFERACVDFHETKRHVRTASSEQVRQPIHRAALDHWRNFSSDLGPLEQALGPALGAYPS